MPRHDPARELSTGADHTTKLATLREPRPELALPSDASLIPIHLYASPHSPTRGLQPSLSAQRLKFSCKRPPEQSEEGRLSAAILSYAGHPTASARLIDLDCV